MTTIEKANELFGIIRNGLFSDSPDLKDWKVEIYTECPRHPSFKGFCNQREKTIYLRQRDGVNFQTIVHECCHAVCGGHHGLEWRIRMMDCARVFAAIGATGLAKALREDTVRHMRADWLERKHGEAYVVNRIREGKL